MRERESKKKGERERERESLGRGEKYTLVIRLDDVQSINTLYLNTIRILLD